MPNPANLRPGGRGKARGKLGDRVLTRQEIAKAREAAFEAVADEVSRAIGATGAGMNHIERLLGRRQSTGKVRRAIAGVDVKLSSLADLALVTGRRLVVRLEENYGRS